MIKFAVTNMACGSCRLKIKSKLDENNFNVKDIDIDSGELLVEASKADMSKIHNLLEGMKYVIDDESVTEWNEYRYWNDALMDNEVMNEFFSYLSNLPGELVGFDEERVEIIYFTNDDTHKEIKAYLDNKK